MKRLALVLTLISQSSYAHEAPKGWMYGWECCSTSDCWQSKDADIKETKQGYLVAATGEVIGYNDKRIKPSQDEFYHRCSKGGKPDAETLCIYVPNKSY